MKSLQEIAARRGYLLDLLSETEAGVRNPRLLPKQREAARKLCLVLACSIEQLEWILGMRSSTMVDLADDFTR